VEKENVLHFGGATGGSRQQAGRTTGKQQESGNKLGDKPTKSIGNILTKLQLKVSRQHVGCCQSGWHFPGAAIISTDVKMSARCDDSAVDDYEAAAAKCCCWVFR